MCLSAAVIGYAASAHGAQTPEQGRGGDCSQGVWGGDRSVSHCEVREQTMPLINPIDVDAGRNGSIAVRGSDRRDVLVRATVRTFGATDADARRVAAGVRIEAVGGRVRSDGPTDLQGEGWSVSFEIDVPRTAQMALNTRNGSIAIADFGGAVEFHAQNGSIQLRRVDGDIRGTTSNGSVSLTLDGNRWNGQGLDVQTRNGSIQINVPDGYAAEIETSTTRGRVQNDFQAGGSNASNGPLTTTVGGGGARLRVTTVNGSVSIRRRT
jgi:hypothetical protein